jgi:predicted nucleic acid-binding protein
LFLQVLFSERRLTLRDIWFFERSLNTKALAVTIPPPRANFFDASALVKVYCPEHDGRTVRNYFLCRAPTRYTTPFCFYEALNVLKSKWKYQDKISEAQYHSAASDLTNWYSRARATRTLKDMDLTEIETLREVRGMAQKHSLDFSDALQIVSVKSGPFSHMISRSKTILVTADRGLAGAARAEGLRVWSVLDEPEP